MGEFCQVGMRRELAPQKITVDMLGMAYYIPDRSDQAELAMTVGTKESKEEGTRDEPRG